MQHAARLVERRVLLNELLTRRLLVLHVLLLMLRNLLLLLLRLDQAGEPRAAGQAVIARTRRCRAVDTVDTGHARRARAVLARAARAARQLRALHRTTNFRHGRDLVLREVVRLRDEDRHERRWQEPRAPRGPRGQLAAEISAEAERAKPLRGREGGTMSRARDEVSRSVAFARAAEDLIRGIASERTILCSPRSAS